MNAAAAAAVGQHGGAGAAALIVAAAAVQLLKQFTKALVCERYLPATLCKSSCVAVVRGASPPEQQD